MLGDENAKMAIFNFKKKIDGHVIQRKIGPMDDTLTDFVDLDQVIHYHLQEYRDVRRKNQKNICNIFNEYERSMSRNE